MAITQSSLLNTDFCQGFGGFFGGFPGLGGFAGAGAFQGGLGMGIPGLGPDAPGESQGLLSV